MERRWVDFSEEVAGKCEPGNRRERVYYRFPPKIKIGAWLGDLGRSGGLPVPIIHKGGGTEPGTSLSDTASKAVGKGVLVPILIGAALVGVLVIVGMVLTKEA